MALTLFTDSYVATVAEVDQFMLSNNQWNELADDAAKEVFIKGVTQLIDSSFHPGGDLVAPAQALKFPRNFGTSRDTIRYTLAEQTNALRLAVWQAIETILEQKVIGLANFRKNPKMAKRQIVGLSIHAFDALSYYQEVDLF